MHQIKDTELTASEKYFIENSLRLIDDTFSVFVDYNVDVENIDVYFASALQPIIDAQELVRDANSGVDVVDRTGNPIDVDFKLTTAETEYQNFIVEIKRAHGVVSEMKNILDGIYHVAQGKQSEYLPKMDEMKERIEGAIAKLNCCITNSPKDDENYTPL